MQKGSYRNKGDTEGEKMTNILFLPEFKSVYSLPQAERSEASVTFEYRNIS